MHTNAHQTANRRKLHSSIARFIVTRPIVDASSFFANCTAQCEILPTSSPLTPQRGSLHRCRPSLLPMRLREFSEVKCHVLFIRWQFAQPNGVSSPHTRLPADGRSPSGPASRSDRPIWPRSTAGGNSTAERPADAISSHPTIASGRPGRRRPAADRRRCPGFGNCASPCTPCAAKRRRHSRSASDAPRTPAAGRYPR